MRLLLKISIIVCFLLHFTSRGQTSLFYDKYYKVGYTNVQNNNILLLEDSTYAFLSYVKDSATGRQDLGLFKIDKYGNFLIKKTINYFNLDYLRPGTSFNTFINSSKTSLMSVAGTYSGTLSTIIFTKINKLTLDTLKTNLYNDATYQYNIGNLIKMNPNKFYAIGNKFTASLYWPVIFELDSNLIIKNTITCSNTNSLTAFFGMYDSFNKKLIMGGAQFIGPNGNGFIAISDTLGNITNTHVNTTSTINGLSQIFYSTYDNTYISIGGTRSSVYGGNNMYRLQVCKYSSSLTPIWQKTYGHANIVNNFYDGIVNPDGSMIIVGRFSDSVANPLTNINCNAVMLKIRSNGDSLWMKQFDSLNYTAGPSNYWYESFFGVEKTPEGGYIMCGNAQQMPLSKAWVIKTDSLGCDLASCMPTGISENKNTIAQIYVFPNPVSNTLNISMQQKEFDKLEIEITNTLGQAVLKLPYSNQIDVSKLSQGFYNLKIISKGDQIYYSKFIKE